MADKKKLPGPVDSTLKAGGLLFLAALGAALLTAWIAPSGKLAGPDPFYGMVIGPQVEVQNSLAKLDALGVNTVRLRMDVKDWGRPGANTGGAAYDGALGQAPVLKKRGFRVVLQVNSEGGAMPSYPRAKALFQWLLRRPGAGSVDVVEVLGPVTEQAANADAFSSTLTRAQQAQRYVGGPLRAADEVFHAARKKVLGAAFTPWQQASDLRPAGAWTLSVTKAYVAAGYLDRVDYAGFQADQPTAAAQVDWVRRAAALFGRKPVWVSEWQLNRSAFGDDGSYVDAMGAAARSLHGLVGTACYAGLTPAEGVVPVTKDGRREAEPAFKAYRSWPKK
ncbi:MAG TPA: hypothetical protein VEL73_00960 [Mycobacteriales bacterium]|nr:hypothetical protein [Mycobacteriales bacterium]